MSFNQYVNEAKKYGEAIFLYKEEHGSAKKFEEKLWDYIEENPYVTIEDVNIESYKNYEDQFTVRIIGHFDIVEKQWKSLVKDIQKKFGIEFIELA